MHSFFTRFELLHEQQLRCLIVDQDQGRHGNIKLLIFWLEKNFKAFCWDLLVLGH